MYIPTTFYSSNTSSYNLARYKVDIDCPNTSFQYVAPNGILRFVNTSNQTPWFIQFVYVVAVFGSVEGITGCYTITKLEDISYPINGYSDGISYPSGLKGGSSVQIAAGVFNNPYNNSGQLAIFGTGSAAGGFSGCWFRDTLAFFTPDGNIYTNYTASYGDVCITVNGPKVPYPWSRPSNCYLYEFYLPTASLQTATYTDCVTGLPMTSSISETSYFCVKEGSATGLTGIGSLINILGLSGCSGSV